jgi:hypothetical protein
MFFKAVEYLVVLVTFERLFWELGITNLLLYLKNQVNGQCRPFTREIGDKRGGGTYVPLPHPEKIGGEMGPQIGA